MLLRRERDRGAWLLDLGLYRLPGAEMPERLFQAQYPAMTPDAFPPLKAEGGGWFYFK